MKPYSSRRRFAVFSVVVMLVVALLGSLPPAGATGTIIFDASPGAGPPPATLGPYTMIPFARDEPLNTRVTDVNGPTGVIHFDESLQQTVVNDQWSGWGHGYTDNVYYWPLTTPQRVVISLPPETGAFYFYVKLADAYGATIEATANNAVSSGPLPASPWDARYYGFYATGGATLDTITVVLPEVDKAFAIGEFAIARVEPHHRVQFHQPLDPSTSDGIITNKAKAGRTIPIKLEIFRDETEQDAGNTATPPNLVISEVGCSADATDSVEGYVDGGGEHDATFRWSEDPPGFWITNLDTSAAGMRAGHCYRLDIELNGVQVTGENSQWAVVEVVK